MRPIPDSAGEWKDWLPDEGDPPDHPGMRSPRSLASDTGADRRNRREITDTGRNSKLERKPSTLTH